MMAVATWCNTRPLEILHRQSARLDRQDHLTLRCLIDHRRENSRRLEKLAKEAN